MARRPRKKVLIFSASAGAGHARAAEALIETAELQSLPLEVRHHDILDFTFPLFKKVYGDIQSAIVNASPELWGFLYNKSASSRQMKKPAFIKAFDHFNFHSYMNILRTEQPDAVVCTHFLPYAAIAGELEKQSWRIPFFSVATDYEVHSLWMNRSVKRFYVPSDEAAWSMQQRGIPAGRIRITGIPVAPSFSAKVSKRGQRKQLAFPEDAFTIMILSGGFGLNMMNDLVPAVMEFLLKTFARRKIQVVVVCGKNVSLQKTFGNLRYGGSVNLKVFGFVRNIDQLMSASDVLITKAGGLTVTEALAKRLPMILYDPVPGEEGRNAMYLIERGAALGALSLPTLQYKLKECIEKPEILRLMSRQAAVVARPSAAADIWDDVMKHL